MKLSLSELITKVRRDLSEREEGFFKDDDIIGWLNEGQQDVAKKAYPNNLQHYEFIEEASGEKFPLPDDLLDLFEVYVAEEEIKPQEINSDRGYYTWSEQIFFTFELNNSKLELYFYRLPVKMENDSDYPDLPEEYHQILIDYALFKAKMKDEKPSMGQNYYQKYVSELNNLKSEHGQKPRAQKVKVVR